MKKYTKGFTLIELLVVIAIVSLLSSVILSSLSRARVKATTSATNSAVLQYRNAIELYALAHNNHYPLTSTLPSGACLGNYSPITNPFSRCGLNTGTAANTYGIHSLTSSLASALSNLNLSTGAPAVNGAPSYISGFPPVNMRPFNYDGNNLWIGAVYICEALDSSSGNQCSRAHVDWYLNGTNQTCISGAIVVPDYNSQGKSTKCTLNFGS